MKLSIFLLIFLSLSFFSCEDKKIQSGEIEYEISYPYNKLSKLMEMMLPKTMTTVFKDGKMITTIKKGNLFTTKVYSNEITKELEMRLKMGSDIFKTTLTEEDFAILLKSQPKYSFSKPTEGDSLVNCYCRHYEVECLSDSMANFQSVFTSDFAIHNATWFSSFSEIKGMPLEYVIDRYGLVMKVKATKLTQREVEDSEFDPILKYKAIPYNRYNKKMQDLFDVMLD